MKKFPGTACIKPFNFCPGSNIVFNATNIIRLSLAQSPSLSLMSITRCSHPFHFPMHIPVLVEYQSVRKTKGIKATAQRNSLSHRISNFEGGRELLRASRWLRTYLPPYWLSESNRIFLILGKLLFIRRYILFNPK